MERKKNLEQFFCIKFLLDGITLPWPQTEDPSQLGKLEGLQQGVY